jgi:hypothetical protein
VSGGDLAQLTQAEKLLATIDRTDEALELADMAEAVRVWAAKSKAGYRVENYATSIKARATIRMATCADEGQRRGEIATAGGDRQSIVTPRDNAPASLADLGVPPMRLNRARKLAAVMTEADITKAIAAADAKEHATNLAELERQAAKAKREQDKVDTLAAAVATAANMPSADGRWRVLHKDIREIGEDVQDGSLDVIITDPPYPKKHLLVYGYLGAFAASKLKPGGSLICMVGQSYLPTIVAALGEHLRYHWTAAYLTPGGQAVQLWERKVNTFWKPLLWFVSGDYNGPWVGDVSRSDVNDNDKRFHDWGQSESGMADIVERFSKVGDLVCDPFCGAGTTGVVAIALDRMFVGSDVDGDSVAKTKARLAEVAL